MKIKSINQPFSLSFLVAALAISGLVASFFIGGVALYSNLNANVDQKKLIYTTDIQDAAGEIELALIGLILIQSDMFIAKNKEDLEKLQNSDSLKNNFSKHLDILKRLSNEELSDEKLIVSVNNTSEAYSIFLQANQKLINNTVSIIDNRATLKARTSEIKQQIRKLLSTIDNITGKLSFADKRLKRRVSRILRDGDGLDTQESIQKLSDYISGPNVERIDLSKRLSSKLLRFEALFHEFNSITNIDTLISIKANRAKQLIIEVNKLISDFDKTVTDNKIKYLISNLRNDFSYLQKIIFSDSDSLFSLRKSFIENSQLQRESIQTSKLSSRKAKKSLTNLTNEISAMREIIVADSTQSLKTSMAIAILIFCMTFVVLLLLSFYIIRSVKKQLGVDPIELGKFAKAIASGDFSLNIETGVKDSSSVLFFMKGMQTNLQLIISQIKNVADTINVTSSELSKSNSELSLRTETQASNLEETASCMEELTITVKQNADNAKQASNLSNSASEIAKRGGEDVSKVVNTMVDINESSRKIVDIISVINELAFQTKLLALNAAVEAARAGEHGRGFAVVAAEVGNLAKRSASAAKEIKVLIENSVEKVETGKKLVDTAGLTMAEIVTAVKQVSDIMSEISYSSTEQSEGINQANEAIIQIDDATQKNAVLLESTAESSNSLDEQAGLLMKSIRVFKFKEDSKS